MKLDIANSSRHMREHAVALIILTGLIKCINPTQKVAYLVDDRSLGIYAQKRDTNKDIDNKEETVLNSFLGISNSKVLSPIEITAWTEKTKNFE